MTIIINMVISYSILESPQKSAGRRWVFDAKTSIQIDINSKPGTGI